MMWLGEGGVDPLPGFCAGCPTTLQQVSGIASKLSGQSKEVVDESP